MTDTTDTNEETQFRQEEDRLSALVKPLLKWYDENKRDLPWRREISPYRTWISEIMLQQTRVEAGRGYFLRFMEKLPDVEALANVDDGLLMKLWEGLGYYNRARNLKKAAGVVMEQHSGRLPETYEELLALPGIGSYTAGAIGSIAFGLKVPAVDGNVLRVLARVKADYEDILKPSVKKQAEVQLQRIMPEERPGDFNQALMELGACVCIPNGSPKCGECPVAACCKAHLSGEAELLPVKKKKKGRRKEEKTLLLLYVRDRQDSSNRLALKKRPDKGLLAGLYELPSLPGLLDERQVTEALAEAGMEIEAIESAGRAVHVFSHVEWHMEGYRVQVKQNREGWPLLVKEETETTFYSRDLEEKRMRDEETKLEEGLSAAGLLWIGEKELKEDFALPTAFRYFDLRFP